MTRALLKSVGRLIQQAVAGLMLATIPALASAQFPQKAVSVVAPFPPGGAADTLARIVARHLSQQFPQSSFLVENKPGAGTIVGTQHVARAPADGYTLLLSGNATFTMNAALHSTLPYDPVKNFDAIGLIGSIPYVLVAHPKVPADTLGQLVELARKEPGRLNYASFGNGTGAHFAAEMFKKTAGVDLTHVPYKGSAPAMQDLIGGQVQVMFETNIGAVPQIRGGRVKPLAVTSPKRLEALPDVPTMSELGYAGAAFTGWMAVVAPRGLAPETRDALVRALANAMATSQMQADLRQVGLQVQYEPPSSYEARLRTEIPTMKEMVKAMGIAIN